MCHGRTGVGMASSHCGGRTRGAPLPSTHTRAGNQIGSSHSCEEPKYSAHVGGG
jgi:hypothetical protein